MLYKKIISPLYIDTHYHLVKRDLVNIWQFLISAAAVCAAVFAAASGVTTDAATTSTWD